MYCLFCDRTKEIFCETLLPGFIFTLTLSKCILLPWWCWKKMSSSERCVSTWSPNSEQIWLILHINLCFHQAHPCLIAEFIKKLQENPNLFVAPQMWVSLFFPVILFRVKEEVFWKNYFYRVSLIKQSAQLTALAAHQAAERRHVEKPSCGPQDPHQKGTLRRAESNHYLIFMFLSVWRIILM